MQSLNITPDENSRQNSAETDYATVAQAKSGANWFYWIAGLSLINTLIFLFGGAWSFFAGLGVTQIIDAVVSQLTPDSGVSALKIIAVLVDVTIAGVFLMFGLYANKFHIWAFIAGMILYLLDGLLLLVFGAFLPAGFHLFALFMIFRGLTAARQLKAAQAANNIASANL